MNLIYMGIFYFYFVDHFSNKNHIGIVNFFNLTLEWLRRELVSMPSTIY